jgi:ribosome-associated protein
VCLKFDLSPESTSCLWLPDDVKERLVQQQASRINKAGELTLNVQEHRTQLANKKAAVQRLKEMILLAWLAPKVREMKTELSPQTKQRRKEDKRRRGLVKQSRRSPVDW